MGVSKEDCLKLVDMGRISLKGPDTSKRCEGYLPWRKKGKSVPPDRGETDMAYRQMAVYI